MRKLSVTVAVGLIVALIGGGLIFAYGRSVDHRIADGKKTVEVLVALKALLPGTPAISLEEDTGLREIPQAYLPKGSIRDLTEVSGQVLLGPLPEGASLNKAHFGSPSAVAAVEPAAGNVALAVQVGISPGVARYIRVGSFVDVFVTYTGGGGGLGQQGKPSQSENRTKLFVTGVKVLAVSIAVPQEDSPNEGDPNARNGQAQQQESGAGQVIAILDVDPVTAERIVNALSIGELYLALSKENAGHKTPTGVVPDDVVTSNR